MKLTRGNEQVFFERVEEGESYEYSAAYHLFDVEKLASEFGVEIEYNDPGTDVYMELGSLHFTVVGIKE